MLNSTAIGAEIPVKIRYRKLALPDQSGFTDGGELVVTMNALTLSSLALYTKDQWNQIMDQLHDANTEESETLLSLRRLVIGNAEELLVKDGKIGIPQHLMSQAGLHRDAIWIQRANQIEIRSPESRE